MPTEPGVPPDEQTRSPLAVLTATIHNRLWAMFPPREVDLGAESHQALAACDLVRQTDLCLTAYVSRQRDSTEGARLLHVFGLLQAIAVQQDAVRYLFEAVGQKYSFWEDERLRRIRDLRVMAVGHPARRDRGAPTSSNVLLTLDVHPNRLLIRANYHDNKARPPYGRWVDLVAVIDDQRAALGRALGELSETVRTAWERADPEAYFG